MNGASATRIQLRNISKEKVINYIKENNLSKENFCNLKSGHQGIVKKLVGYDYNSLRRWAKSYFEGFNAGRPESFVKTNKKVIKC